MKSRLSYAKRPFFKSRVMLKIWAASVIVMGLLSFLQRNNPLALPGLAYVPYDYVNLSKSAFYRELEEEYDIAYQSFNHPDTLIKHVVALYPDSSQNPARVQALDQLLRQRYYHAVAVYGWRDDWLAWMLGTLFWINFKAIVIPEELLDQEVRFAMCSQQALVLMHLLQKLQIPYRSVGLNGHFVTEVFYAGKWHYHDPNYEVRFSPDSLPPSAKEMMENQALRERAYAHCLTKAEIAQIFLAQFLDYGRVNELPAARARLLHQITHFLSAYAWLLCLCGGVLIGLWKSRGNLFFWQNT
ncbi:MAG: hypothetical protein HC913_02935 [Microscillaceae bacterium]|nr:hypothetical protein [Microscillaceae bacterium]